IKLLKEKFWLTVDTDVSTTTLPRKILNSIVKHPEFVALTLPKADEHSSTDRLKPTLEWVWPFITSFNALPVQTEIIWRCLDVLFSEINSPGGSEKSDDFRIRLCVLLLDIICQCFQAGDDAI